MSSQLREGFADVFGQAAEKIIQNPGMGVEQDDDWDIAEDVNGPGTWLRSSDRDDADAGHWFGGTWVNNKFHSLDNANPSPGWHDIGNLANVMFKLLALGGQNPAYARHLEWPGVGNVLSGVGLTKATRILMDAVWFYSYPSQDWSLVGSAAIVAARDDYYPGMTEQEQVYKAFEAIGHPPTQQPF